MYRDILRRALGLAGMAVLATSPAAAQPDTQREPQARISFADMGGIRDWRADGDKALYVEGRNGQWYRAELMSSCIGLNFAQHIGFVTEPDGSFDKFSAVLVEGRPCQITSLVKSAEPPSRKARPSSRSAE